MHFHAPSLDASDLQSAVQDLIQAAVRHYPQPIQEAVGSLRHAVSFKDLDRKLDDLISVALDWSRSGEITLGWSTDHCDCILCGSSVASKLGIERHYRRRECSVLWPIKAMARIQYAESRQGRAEIEAQEQAETLRFSTLCVVDLADGEEPVALRYLPSSRHKELAWAEARLSTLGFSKVVKAIRRGITETRWEKITEDAYILADPREKGRIKFRAWPLAQVSNGKLPKYAHRQRPEFLLDTWNKGLEGKLQVRVDALLKAWA